MSDALRLPHDDMSNDALDKGSRQVTRQWYAEFIPPLIRATIRVGDCPGCSLDWPIRSGIHKVPGAMSALGGVGLSCLAPSPPPRPRQPYTCAICKRTFPGPHDDHALFCRTRLNAAAAIMGMDTDDLRDLMNTGQMALGCKDWWPNTSVLEALSTRMTPTESVEAEKRRLAEEKRWDEEASRG